MGKVVSGITQGLGLTADPNAGSGAAAGAQALEARAVQELEKLNIPDIEKQRLMLEIPKLVGLMQAEQLDESALEDLDLDPRLRDNIMQAIASEQEYADEGLTDEDIARREALLRSAQADEQARQASIMQSMAERGAGGAGSELAARLASNQAQSDRAQQQALQLAAEASQNRRQATQNVANMSSQLDAQDFARQAQRASAADEIARFNAMNRQNIAGQNLASQQSIADQGTALRNQQQMANKGLYQQQFQNQMAKATGLTNQLQNQASGMYNQANRQAQAAQAQAAGNRELLGAGIKAYAASDKKAKENVRDAKNDDIKDMLDKLKPKKFDYKMEHGGVRNNTGVMAQDLEKSDLGRDMVEEINGTKMVDKEKMLMNAMASLASLNDRINDLEKGKVGEDKSEDKVMESGDNVDQILEALKQLEMPGTKYFNGGAKPMIGDPMIDNDPRQSARLQAAVMGMKDTLIPDTTKELRAREAADGPRRGTTEAFNAFKQELGLGKTGSSDSKETNSKPKTSEKKKSDPLSDLGDALIKSGQNVSDLPDAPRKVQMDPMRFLANDGGMKNLAKAVKGDNLKLNEAMKMTDDKSKLLSELRKFMDGGMESPASFTEGGERVDELLDAGELTVNEAAQEQLMDYMRGKLNMEDLEGRIIEGDSYSGDLLPDRINSGEMVLNVSQQERVKKDLMNREAKSRGFNKLLEMLGNK